MGAEHFEQMLHDATKVDQEALPMAMMMRGSTCEAEAALFGGGYWDHLPPDRRVEIARNAVELRNWFSERLQGMLVEGDVTVWGRNPHTGKMVHIRDPSVIDFDDPVLPFSLFVKALEAFN